MTGLGRQHPLENGFTWHPTLGVPYIPGSSLKGLLRAWDREENAEWHEGSRRNAFVETEITKERFGTQDRVGGLVFFDVLPMTKPTPGQGDHDPPLWALLSRWRSSR